MRFDRTLRALALIAFVAATSLVGAQTTKVKPVTLSVYMQNDLANPQNAYWPVTLEAFAKKYPNIKLEFEYVADEAYHQKFQAMAASGDIPDLFTCYAGSPLELHPRPRHGQGLYAPTSLTSFKKQLQPRHLAAPGTERARYTSSPPTWPSARSSTSTPSSRSSWASRIPKTLDEMIAQAPKIRAAGYDAPRLRQQGPVAGPVPLPLHARSTGWAAPRGSTRPMKGQRQVHRRSIRRLDLHHQENGRHQALPRGRQSARGHSGLGGVRAGQGRLPPRRRLESLRAEAGAAKPEDYADLLLPSHSRPSPARRSTARAPRPWARPSP